MTKAPAKVDFNVIRLEYVTTTIGYKNLAKKYGLSYGALRTRGCDGGWGQARIDHQQKLTAEATQAVTEDAIKQLKDWNATDLKVATVVRAKAVAQLQQIPTDSQDPFDLERLTMVMTIVEKAQRMARLALGASTDNRGLGDFNGNPLPPPTLGDVYQTLVFVEPGGIKTDVSGRVIEHQEDQSEPPAGAGASAEQADDPESLSVAVPA
jgi:hypothetical protein